MPFNDPHVSKGLLQGKGDFRLDVNMDGEYWNPGDMT